MLPNNSTLKFYVSLSATLATVFTSARQMTPMGSSTKYVCSYFVIIDPSSPLYVHIAFSLHTPPPQYEHMDIILKDDRTVIYFVNYCQSKNHQKCYKIKKLLYKTIRKY